MNDTQTCRTWTWDNNYSRAWAETSDPRVLAIIERDTDSQGPDSDALAPAYWIEYRACTYESNGRAGSTFNDDDAAEAYMVARTRAPYRPPVSSEEFAARYMRIFHGTTVAIVRSRVNQGGSTVLLLNTPAFRAHIGIDNADGSRALNGAGSPTADEIALSLDGEMQEFQAWLDGDVYGVGHAVNPERISHDDEIDLDTFDVELTCWGFYGEDYAKEAALEMDYETPNLAPLPIPQVITWQTDYSAPVTA